MITIGELLSRVVLPPSNKDFVDKDFRIIYLKVAIEQIDVEKLGLSKQFDKLYSQGDFIFKFFNELNSEFKTIDELNTYDTYGFYAEHLAILKKIYENYVAVLDKNNLCDNITLPLEFSINKDFLSEFPNITIFYEGYFSLFEFKIINKISGLSLLNLHCSMNKFNKKNIELFKGIGLDLDVGFDYILDISNKKIIAKMAYLQNDLKYEVYEVPNRLIQIGMVKNSISKMIQNGISPSSIVLILPDEKFAKYIKSFDSEQYFNFAMGSDIKYSSVYKISHAINNYLNIDEPKYEARIEYFNIDKQYLQNEIRPKWKKLLCQDTFFELFDFVSKDETNNDLQKELFELRILLQNLLFGKEMDLKLTLKDGFKIFIKKLNKITIDDIKSGKITVMGILETRYTKYDGVIVVDFNDNIVPKKSVKDKFISSNVKKYSNLPTSIDRENLQKYYYKKLFDNAKEVYISYVTNKENTISR
ncbi:MAG: PD-(D/E)XK nuclease family protein, partial [Arcobacter sp.]|nr:PD-(D/E)XK nuclease family protein [Arcobacter sp.]